MLFGSLLDKFKKYNPTYSSVKTAGSTPVYGYDIDIGMMPESMYDPEGTAKFGQQYGKTSRTMLKKWEAQDAQKSADAGEEWSGYHPGVESGYQGGLEKFVPEEGSFSSRLSKHQSKKFDLQKGSYHGDSPVAGAGPWSGTKVYNEMPVQSDRIVGWKNPKKQGQTAEEKKADQQEALKLAMEDAVKYSGAMQGKTIPGVPPGGGSRDRKMSIYDTGGYDLTSNRPIADTDAVRKRFYGIMGFGR